MRFVQNVRALLLDKIIPKYNIADYFLADVKHLVKDFEGKLRALIDAPARQPNDVTIHLIQDPEYKPFGCSVDLQAAVSKFYYQRLVFVVPESYKLSD